MSDFRGIRWSNDPTHIGSRFRQYRRLAGHWGCCCRRAWSRSAMRTTCPTPRAPRVACSTPAAWNGTRPASTSTGPGASSGPPASPRCASRSTRLPWRLEALREGNGNPLRGGRERKSGTDVSGKPLRHPHFHHRSRRKDRFRIGAAEQTRGPVCIPARCRGARDRAGNGRYVRSGIAAEMCRSDSSCGIRRFFEFFS